MKSYKDVTCWENERRLRKLSQFRNHVVAYFNYSRRGSLGESLCETEEARTARLQINLLTDEICRIVLAAGVDAGIEWIPPRRIGGPSQNVHVFVNMFSLNRFGITPDYPISLLERAIGVYQSDRVKSVVRTLNPFWWIGRGLGSFARVPFDLLNAAGFNANKAEKSLIGRSAKLILMLIPVIAGFLAILDYMAWLDDFKSLFGMGE